MSDISDLHGVLQYTFAGVPKTAVLATVPMTMPLASAPSRRSSWARHKQNS
jgi:hypothetical protein